MWSKLFSELKLIFKSFRFLYKAIIYLNKKEYKNGIENLEKAIAIAKQGSEISNYPLGILYYQLGYAYNLTEEFDKAFESLSKSHKILSAETGNYTVDLAENYIELALSRFGVNEYESAIVYFHRANDIFLELNFEDKQTITFIYRNLGIAYRRVGRFEKSSEYYQKALLIHEQNKKEKEIVLKLKAEIFWNKADYQKAIECRNEILKIRLKNFNPTSLEVTHCHLNLGELYIKIGDEINALENFTKVINYRKQKNIPDYSMIHLYSSLGRTYKIKKDYEKAISYVKQAIIYAEEKKDYTLEDLIEFQTEIGYLYKLNYDIKNSITYYENAHSMYQNLSDKNRSLSFEIFYELAHLYEKENKRIKANYFFKKLIKLYNTDLWQDLPYLAVSYSYYGEVWLNRKNSEKAIQFLEKAQSLHLKSVTQNEIKAIAITTSNYINLSKAYSLKKEYEKAIVSLLSGLSAFLNYTTDDAADLSYPWEKYKEIYIQKNKEHKTAREINYFLHFYKEIKINFIETFYENLKKIYLQKSDYKKIIQFFEKHSKEKPRHYNWCQERIRRLQELQFPSNSKMTIS